MGSRSPAPSGTPTNRSKGSFGWSIRTSAKVREKEKASIEFVSIVHSRWKEAWSLFYMEQWWYVFRFWLYHLQLITGKGHKAVEVGFKNFSVLNNNELFSSIPPLLFHLDKMLFCASICRGLKCCFARVPCLYTGYGSLRQHTSPRGGLPQLLSR